MKLLPFVQKADPFGRQRLGILLPDGERVVDLQAGHFAMTEAPHPALRDQESYRQAGEHAHEVARKVVEWVTGQQPPGTVTRLDAVRPLAPPEPLAAVQDDGASALRSG